MEEKIIFYIAGIISTVIGVLINYWLTTRREGKKEIRLKLLEAYNYSTQLIMEINIFITSQKHYSENHEEYSQRAYHGRPIENIENPSSAINLQNKNFYEFFGFDWLSIFYKFIGLIEINIPILKDQTEELKILVENIYPNREIWNWNDNPNEYYQYIIDLKNKFDLIHKEVKSKLY